MSEYKDSLWRYMKLSSLFLLMEGKAWFPSVKSLQACDPFEGKLADDFHREFWEELEAAGHGGDDTKKWLFNSLSSEMKNFLNLNHGYLGLSSQELGKAYFEEISKKRTAWCWHQSDIESAAMWSIYGNQGVAVITNRDSLNRAMQGAFSSTQDFHIQQMEYVDRRVCNPRYIGSVLRAKKELINRSHFLKAREYEHEKELRVTTLCAKGYSGRLVCNIDPNILIHEIIISPLTPPSEAAAIEKAVLKEIEHIDIRQSNLTGEDKRSGLVNILAHALGNSVPHDDEPELPAHFKKL